VRQAAGSGWSKRRLAGSFGGHLRTPFLSLAGFKKIGAAVTLACSLWRLLRAESP
jgi:hypothetical protein